MQKSYSLGDTQYDTMIISFSASISTVGIADTVSAQINGGQFINKITSANNANGNINPAVPIGNVASLRGSSYKIVTVIDLGAVAGIIIVKIINLI